MQIRDRKVLGYLQENDLAAEHPDFKAPSTTSFKYEGGCLFLMPAKIFPGTGYKTAAWVTCSFCFDPHFNYSMFDCSLHSIQRQSSYIFALSGMSLVC